MGGGAVTQVIYTASARVSARKSSMLHSDERRAWFVAAAMLYIVHTTTAGAQDLRSPYAVPGPRWGPRNSCNETYGAIRL